MKPTPHPEVNEVATRLLEGARTVLGSNMVAMYLYGSLAWGDFDPTSSDIDFVTVTREPLDETTFRALAAMHAAVTASGSRWSHDIEGYYLPLANVRRWSPDQPPVPRIERGDTSALYWTHQHSDGVIQRHQVRERGIVLAGPQPSELIDPVSPAQLREAVAALIPPWEEWLTGPDSLRGNGGHNFAVLTLARMLYTLSTGEVASKPAAASWAVATLPAPLARLVDRASRQEVRWEDREATLALLAHLIRVSRSRRP
jgi:hypothetical protein